MSRRIFTALSTILTITVMLLLVKGSTLALTNVSLDSRVYRDLEWLAGLGYLPTYSAGITPLSRLEIAALILEGEEHFDKDKDSSKKTVASTLRRLKKHFHQEVALIKGLVPKQNFFKPMEKLHTRYIYQNYQKSPKIPEDIPENEYGQKSLLKAHALIDWSCRGQLLNRLGLHLRPFLFINGQSRFEFIEAYLQYQLKHFYLGIGKEAFWWGQGRHGTLQLTNNAKPFNMMHLTSRSPFILPSLFRYLGLCRFSFFLTELEKHRPYSEDGTSHPTIQQPKFSGLKISFKIHSCLEVGLTRTFLFKEWNDFGDALLARHENSSEGPGNQIGGFDWRITLPFHFQPLTLYGEHAGEDEAGALPSAWAHLGGIYLPAIGPFRQIRFRAEYANIHSSGKPHVWYIHGSSKNGLSYTYQGRIMGHHMDRDSEDLYLSLEWEPHHRFRIRPAFDFEQRWPHDKDKVSEKQRQYLVTLEYSLSQNLMFTAKLVREFIENQEHNLGNNVNNTRSYLSLQLML